MRSAFVVTAAVLIAACASQKANTSAASAGSRRTPSRATEAASEAELERRLARLELRVLEKEAQVEELQTRLDDARDEVVRTMAKLRSASRAEAASAMAEGDVAIQSFRSSEGSRGLPEMAQSNQLMQLSTAEFNKENYGGALYLANQAKNAAAAGRTRLSAGARTAGGTRSGETPFALPLRLRVANRGNVREGPGTGFSVAYEVAGGTTLTAFSYLDEWIRVADEAGRAGWIFRTLIARP